MTPSLLPGFEPTALEAVRGMTLSERVDRVVALLRQHEPPEGYYLAFSGGKDSCTIKKLAQISGVKFEAWYSQTTIDPPELVRFIKSEHPDVHWRIPEHGNMMARIQYHGMPTRFMRWCCRDYKETGGEGRVCVFGVRAAESHARALRWKEVSTANNSRMAICPIVYWDDDQVWEFLAAYHVPSCELYGQGFDRLGCVGCPLISGTKRQRQFDRWPKFGENWKKACRKYWETHRNQVLRNGKMNFCGKFKTWEEYWQWWMSDKTPDVYRDECQSGLLWTNDDGEEEI